MKISYVIWYEDDMGLESQHYCYDHKDLEKQLNKLKSEGYDIIKVSKHKPVK